MKYIQYRQQGDPLDKSALLNIINEYLSVSRFTILLINEYTLATWFRLECRRFVLLFIQEKTSRVGREESSGKRGRTCCSSNRRKFKRIL